MTREIAADEVIEAAAEAVATLRAGRVRVHCLTNAVAQAFTANVLLAAGAIPSMTLAETEITAFAGRADAVLLNLGTLDAARMSAMRISAVLCREAGKPFVLDPVLCDVSQPRLAFARELIELGPSIIRVNRDEADAIGPLALGRAGCLAVTGEHDRITADGFSLELANGHPWLGMITAAGCAQGALMAALLGTGAHARTAATAAILWVNVAAEQAAGRAAGPGSFLPALIDRIHSIEPSDLVRGARQP